MNNELLSYNIISKSELTSETKKIILDKFSMFDENSLLSSIHDDNISFISHNVDELNLIRETQLITPLKHTFYNFIENIEKEIKKRSKSKSKSMILQIDLLYCDEIFHKDFYSDLLYLREKYPIKKFNSYFRTISPNSFIMFKVPKESGNTFLEELFSLYNKYSHNEYEKFIRIRSKPINLKINSERVLNFKRWLENEE